MLDRQQHVCYVREKAAGAFKAVWPLWWRRNDLPLVVKMRLYNALILPLLCHEVAVFRLTKAELRSLEALHRSHLRCLLGVHFPRIMSNIAVYRRSGAKHLGTYIVRQRWNLFGRAMRLPALHRTVREMAAHFASPKRYVRGVAEQVEEEAVLAKLRLKSAEEFWALRGQACKEAAWRPLVKLISRRWERRCVRQDRLDFREGHAKRLVAKRRRPLRAAPAEAEESQVGGGGGRPMSLRVRVFRYGP